MKRRLSDVSAPARLASPGEGLGPDELALPARNHGLPLEAMRYDLTPPGLHYVLTHYDIPSAAPGDHVLCVRAYDEAGNSQPLQQPWNRGGFADNLVQRVPVFCPDPTDIT